MKITTCLKTGCIILAAFLCVPVLAGNPAGTIIFTRCGQDVYLLLADHLDSDRGWGAFGGRAEPDETTEETAARETEEETRGYFKRQDILKYITGTTPGIDGIYVFYFMEVDFVPVARIENNPLPKQEAAFHERGPYAWIPYADIKAHLTSEPESGPYRINPLFLPDNARRDWLWRRFVDNLKVAHERGIIPWDEQYEIAEPSPALHHVR